MKRLPWLMIVCGLWLAGCSRQDSAPDTASSEKSSIVVDVAPSLAALDRGARLFQEHCAQCHGPEAQGHPDWQTPGVVAAPPLNGTGNDWKRSRAELLAVIQNGTSRGGVAVMPAWKGRLSEPEIADVVAWFQTLWPPEVYATWQRTHTVRAGG